MEILLHRNRRLNANMIWAQVPEVCKALTSLLVVCVCFTTSVHDVQEVNRSITTIGTNLSTSCADFDCYWDNLHKV